MDKKKWEKVSFQLTHSDKKCIKSYEKFEWDNNDYLSLNEAEEISHSTNFVTGLYQDWRRWMIADILDEHPILEDEDDDENNGDDNNATIKVPDGEESIDR